MIYFQVSVDGNAVWVRRTQRRVEALDGFVREFAELNGLLGSAAAQRRTRVLIDLREAAGRNDSEFEAAIAPYRERLFSCNNEIAVLVRTHVGAMQILRHLRSDGVDAPVFGDEDTATRWLHKP